MDSITGVNAQKMSYFSYFGPIWAILGPMGASIGSKFPKIDNFDISSNIISKYTYLGVFGHGDFESELQVGQK